MFPVGGVSSKILPVWATTSRRLLACCASAAGSGPRTAGFSHVFLRKKIWQSPTQVHLMMTRQLQFTPSERKVQRQISRRNWDNVPSDFEMIYESNLKNWVWGYYMAQSVLAAGGCWFVTYGLQPFLNMLSREDTLALMTLCSLFTFSVAYCNFKARHVCIRIYCNSQTEQFIAVRRTCFGRLQKISYYLSDVVLCNKNVVDITDTVKVKVKGKTFQLNSADFVLPMYFNMHVDGTNLTSISESYFKGPEF